MSDRLSVEPGSAKHVHFEQDSRESMVDIYVSTESLRVYDTPWVEDTLPNSPGPLQSQSIMSFVSETSVKRSPYRFECVFLGVVCLFLLIGIICVCVLKANDSRTWRSDKKQLEREHDQCRNRSEHLTSEIQELRKLVKDLCSKSCGQHKKDCESLDINK